VGGRKGRRKDTMDLVMVAVVTGREGGREGCGALSRAAAAAAAAVTTAAGGSMATTATAATAARRDWA